MDGGVGSANDTESAQRHRTFQFFSPVQRFSLMSWSRACLESRMCSIGILHLPEIAFANGGLTPVLVINELVAASNELIQFVEIAPDDLLVGGQKEDLM